MYIYYIKKKGVISCTWTNAFIFWKQTARKMVKFPKCCFQFVKRGCWVFCEPLPLVGSGHGAALIRSG